MRNNLHDLDVAFPIGCFTAVTGISGSGKSSLVSQALPELVGEHLGRPLPASDEDDIDPLLDVAQEATGGRIVGGMEHIKRIVQVDQKPIGRTPRSNLATYRGLFDHVRQLFADTPAARRRRYSPRQVLVQRGARPLPNLRGRRLHDGRAAILAERLCTVLGLSWQPVQPTDAGNRMA